MEKSEGSFVSSMVRSFGKMFFGILGIFLGVLVCSLLYAPFSSSPLIEEKTTLNLMPDAEGNLQLQGFSTPAILEIPIHGVIGDPQKLNQEIVRNILIDSQTGLLANHRVKGILLSFNTPGGTVLDSEEIYRMLKEYKERYKVPIFGYVEGLCASGGMMISCAADEMFSSSSGVIGSVGVVWGPFFNFSNLMNTLGLQAKTFTQGLDKDALNPTRPWTEKDTTSLNAIMQFQYNHFVDLVTSSRPRLDKTKLMQEYGAQIFDCVTAANYGYIDHPMATRADALYALMKVAGMDPKMPYQVVSLVPKNAWISELMKGKSPLFSGQIEHTFGDVSMRILQQPCYLYRHE